MDYHLSTSAKVADQPLLSCAAKTLGAYKANAKRKRGRLIGKPRHQTYQGNRVSFKTGAEKQPERLDNSSTS